MDGVNAVSCAVVAGLAVAFVVAVFSWLTVLDGRVSDLEGTVTDVETKLRAARVNLQRAMDEQA